MATSARTNNQNRFTALRQFQLHTCLEGCDAGGAFTNIYTSPADAFPGAAPRPVTPDLNLRSFDVPDTVATHLRLVVVSNQCTGLPLFNDNSLDADPSSNSDCTLGNAGGVTATDRTVRAAELQVFSKLPEEVTSHAAAEGRRSERGRGVHEAQALPARTQASPKLCGAHGHDDPLQVVRGSRDDLRVPAGATRTEGRTPLPRAHPCAQGTATLYALRTRREPPAAAALGPNRMRFQGRLTRRRALRPGSYRLTLVATDTAGQRSTPKTLTFRLLGRRR